jgi:transposase
MSTRLYPTDLTDSQWEIIQPLIPLAKSGGRPRTLDMRLVINAVMYVTVGGIQWRMLPKEFPKWQSVYTYFRKWRDDGTWQRIHDTLRAEVRERAGRHKHPTAGCLDSQSVKTTSFGGTRGYDAGKKINGSKRHILVDTMGLLLAVVVTAASVQDRDGARLLLAWAAPARSCVSSGWTAATAVNSWSGLLNIAAFVLKLSCVPTTKRASLFCQDVGLSNALSPGSIIIGVSVRTMNDFH